MTTGSGTFFVFTIPQRVPRAMSAVGTSWIARRPSTNAAPAIAPLAAAVTPSTNALTRGLPIERRKYVAGTTTKSQHGRNTPTAAIVAPSGPATR